MRSVKINLFRYQVKDGCATVKDKLEDEIWMTTGDEEQLLES